MALIKMLIDEINKGDDKELNQLAIEILEIIEKNPREITRNEEKILEEIRETVLGD